MALSGMVWSGTYCAMARVRLNGIDLHYELTGSGQKLLFLNGTGATLSQMAPLVSIFADRSRRV